MKRYWKIVSLFIVTVIIIGSFYIQSSLAAKENIKIEFEKVSGNEEEVENVIIHADYAVGNVHQSLQILNEETINLKNQSLLQELTRSYNVSVFKQLIEQNRNFMRGKDLWANYFFEDENLLAYASIKRENSFEQPTSDFSFDIEVINKKSDEITQIVLDVPETENYNWMQVEDVQVNDGELKVISRVFRTDGGNELHVYTFDMKEQKLVSDDLIISTPKIENGWFDLRIFNDFYSFERQNYLLIKKEAFEDESEGNISLEANEIIVYNMATTQSKKLTVPNEMDGFINSSAIFHSTIYIPSQSTDSLEVNIYDIKNEKWGKKTVFDLPQNDNRNDAPYMKLMNGKIYKIYKTNDEHILFIGDLKTGQTLYEGKLKVKNQSDDHEEYRLYIHEIEYVL